jgi:hypothetical protein
VDARHRDPAAPVAHFPADPTICVQLPLQQACGSNVTQLSSYWAHEGWALQTPVRHLPVPLQVVSLVLLLHVPSRHSLHGVPWHVSLARLLQVPSRHSLHGLFSQVMVARLLQIPPRHSLQGLFSQVRPSFVG